MNRALVLCSLAVLLTGCTEGVNTPASSDAQGSTADGARQEPCPRPQAPRRSSFADPGSSAYDVDVDRRARIPGWEAFVVGTLAATTLQFTTAADGERRAIERNATVVTLMLRSEAESAYPHITAALANGVSVAPDMNHTGPWRNLPGFMLPAGELVQAELVFLHHQNDSLANLSLETNGAVVHVPLTPATRPETPVCPLADLGFLGRPQTRHGITFRIDNFTWFSDDADAHPAGLVPPTLSAQFDVFLDNPTAAPIDTDDLEFRFTNGKGWWDSYRDDRPPGFNPQVPPGASWAETRCARVTPHFGPSIGMYVAGDSFDPGIGLDLPPVPATLPPGSCRASGEPWTLDRPP